MTLSLQPRPFPVSSDSETAAEPSPPVGPDHIAQAAPVPGPDAVKEAITRHHRVKWFRGGETKHSAARQHGKSMEHFPFIQINPGDYVNFLVVDVDYEDAIVRLRYPAVPEPHWIVENPDNGHAQAGWMIEPVYRGPDAKEKPVRYANAVKRALELLVDSDPAFAGYLVRNPAANSPTGDVDFGKRHTPYSLDDLKHHMQDYRNPFDDEYRAWPPAPTFVDAAKTAEPEMTAGRNNYLFHKTRREMWRRLNTTGRLPRLNEALDFALSHNEALPSPLGRPEVAQLAASAVRQVASPKGRSVFGRTNRHLSELGKKGGQSVSEAKRAAAAQNARKGTKAREEKTSSRIVRTGALRALGHSTHEIAQALGMTIRTVQRYLKKLPQTCDITQATGISAGAAGTRAVARVPAAPALGSPQAPLTAVVESPPRTRREEHHNCAWLQARPHTHPARRYEHREVRTLSWRPVWQKGGEFEASSAAAERHGNHPRRRQDREPAEETSKYQISEGVAA